MGREPVKSPAENRLTKPAPIKIGHDVGSFQCSRPQLDEWLKKRALSSMEAGTARTFVVCRGSTKVVGYFSLAAGSVEHHSAPGSLKRNTPDPIPVIILARLAVAIEEQGKGLGAVLLSEAMKRAVRASRLIGARALVVHALDQKAANFYEAHGFKTMTGTAYFLPVKTIVSGL